MRVMFVDDEPQVLKGISRMLDCADVEWDVETATSGPEALAALEDDSVDVLVSDMQMPGMDGAQLLDEVSRRHPHIVRIVLSGQASKEAVYRAVAPMHQYLSKPCEADVLRETISRACALREVLDCTKSHDFLGRISSLPSLPSLYQEVVVEIESENGTAARVGEIVSKDPAMTAKLLQLANSAIFGLRSSVSSPAQAVTVIGMDAMKSLVLSLQVFKSFDVASVPGFSIDNLLAHSLRVATIAQLLAKSEGMDKETSTEAFTAGLLHDVGKLILATYASEGFASAIAESNTKHIPLVEVERSLFGLGHDGIGGYLLALWGIPQSIVEAVTFHHKLEQCHGNRITAAILVYAANILVHEDCAATTPEQQQLHEELVASVGISDQFDTWRKVIRLKEE